MNYSCPVTGGGRILLAALLVFFGLLTCTDEVVAPDPEPEPETTTYLQVPSQYRTIQEAIDAAVSGDSIIVAPGVYRGPGNRDLLISGKAITIFSSDGPLTTIIDCQGTLDEPHRGIEFKSGTDLTIVIGFTIKRGYFNEAAAMKFNSASPKIEDCLFVGNTSSISGGAVRCKGSSPSFVNCTFVANSAPTGGSFFLIGGSSPTIVNCIIAFSGAGGAIFSTEATSLPELVCCNIYGNTGGDWVGRIADQLGVSGNRSIDPVFCDQPNGDYRLQPDSLATDTVLGCGFIQGISAIGCE